MYTRSTRKQSQYVVNWPKDMGRREVVVFLDSAWVVHVEFFHQGIQAMKEGAKSKEVGSSILIRTTGKHISRGRSAKGSSATPVR